MKPEERELLDDLDSILTDLAHGSDKLRELSEVERESLVTRLEGAYLRVEKTISGDTPVGVVFTFPQSQMRLLVSVSDLLRDVQRSSAIDAALVERAQEAVASRRNVDLGRE